ncbi:MAG: hypothetical protein ABSA46_05255 [Thermodesulfovibrionales bacterium]|jgi:hypothetical protein
MAVSFFVGLIAVRESLVCGQSNRKKSFFSSKILQSLFDFSRQRAIVIGVRGNKSSRISDGSGGTSDYTFDRERLCGEILKRPDLSRARFSVVFALTDTGIVPEERIRNLKSFCFSDICSVRVHQSFPAVYHHSGYLKPYNPLIGKEVPKCSSSLPREDG